MWRDGRIPRNGYVWFSRRPLFNLGMALICTLEKLNFDQWLWKKSTRLCGETKTSRISDGGKEIDHS